MIIGEVVETKKAFKPNQKNRLGKTLPLGSIEVRIGSNISNVGQVRNVFARPAIFNRRIPLIGEQVILMMAPVNNDSSDAVKGRGWIYFNPINATDDLVLHQYHDLFTRDQEKQATSKGTRKHDRDEPGYTFPKKPRRTFNIQPFEGDDIIEGRFGQSIRLGSTVQGGPTQMNIYQHKPTWKGAKNTDPIMIFRIKKPPETPPPPPINNNSTNKYVIEDINEDDASIYMATTQRLTKFKAGFNKNLDVKAASQWFGKSQIILNADRVIMNATADNAFLIGSKKVIVTGEKVLLQSKKYKVDLDVLMDFLNDWLSQDRDLALGAAQYATACGPTATSTNSADYIKLATIEFQKFKLP